MARADWLEAGAAVLAGGGAAALTIERLCSLTGRTKGSFYHHFKAMGGFEEALLGHWKDANAERVEAARRDERGRDALDGLALGLEAGLESAVRRWAAVNSVARRAVAEVDELRIAFLAGEAGGDDPARLEYAAFLGLLELAPDAAELMRLLGLLRGLLEKGGLSPLPRPD
jgi:AcrR family transcriptional regulator